MHFSKVHLIFFGQKCTCPWTKVHLLHFLQICFYFGEKNCKSAQNFLLTLRIRSSQKQIIVQKCLVKSLMLWIKVLIFVTTIKVLIFKKWRQEFFENVWLGRGVERQNRQFPTFSNFSFVPQNAVWWHFLFLLIFRLFYKIFISINNFFGDF